MALALQRNKDTGDTSIAAEEGLPTAISLNNRVAISGVQGEVTVPEHGIVQVREYV